MNYTWQTLSLALRLCGVSMSAKDAQYLHAILSRLQEKGDQFTVNDAAELEIKYYQPGNEEE